MLSISNDFSLKERKNEYLRVLPYFLRVYNIGKLGYTRQKTIKIHDALRTSLWKSSFIFLER